MHSPTDTFLNDALQSSLEAIRTSLGIDTNLTVSALESMGGSLRVKVTADGLTIDQKIAIEHRALSAFKDIDPSINGINFTRTKTTLQGGTTPVSNPTPNKPFGLSIQKKAIPGVRRIIAVASGKGGVGKSTISSNLAASLANTASRRVGLMDCDVYGPSATMTFGINNTPSISRAGRLEPVEAHKVKIMSFGFFSDVKTPVIWRGPLVSKAIKQMAYDVDWGELDDLILDLPPGTGDVQMTIAESLPIHGAVIVTTPQDVALIDAHKAVSMFERLEVPILGVIENMAWHECGACGHEEAIFGDAAFKKFLDERRLPLLARIPLRSSIRKSADQGQPITLSQTAVESRLFQELLSKII